MNEVIKKIEKRIYYLTQELSKRPESMRVCFTEDSTKIEKLVEEISILQTVLKALYWE